MNFLRVTQKKTLFLNTKNPIKAAFYKRLNFSTALAVQNIDFDEEFLCNDTYYCQLKHCMQSYAKLGCVTNAFEMLNLMKSVSGRPSINDYNALVHIAFKSKKLSNEVLVGIIHFDFKRCGMCPNAITYNIVLNGLLTLGKNEDLVGSVKEMLSRGFKPSFTIMSRILKKLLECGNLVDAFSLFELMLKLNCIPTEWTLNKLIDSLSKVGMIDKAYFVFLVLLDRGYFRGAFSYNPILWALCKCGQSYTALRLLYSLKKRGIGQDASSYSALVYGFSRERLELKTLSCLAEMEKEGCKPNKRTYTNILKFVCDDGYMKRALDIFSNMEKLEEDSQPDIVTVNIILRQLSQQGNIEKIDEIMKTIEQKDLQPDKFTYAALVDGLLKAREIKMAYQFLLFIMKNGKLDAANCNIYLNIWYQLSVCDIDRAYNIEHLFDLFGCNGIKPNSISWNTYLKSLSAKDVDKALKFVDSTDWGENGPDIIFYNTILSAACKQRNKPMIEIISNRMKVEGKCNVVGLTCLIQHYCDIGKISEGIVLLKKMISNGPSPTLVTFNTVINGLCRKGIVNLAYGFSKYMRSKGFTPDLKTYKILLRTSTRTR